MPPALPACIVCCLLEESVCAPQGAKRPPGGTTGKKWNRGAPLSKKAKAKGDSDSQPAPTAAEQQDPLAQAKLTTVLLPAALKDINNSRMQAFFATGAPHDCMTS